MRTLPDNEFDLEKLFLPAWAQEPASAKSYAQFEGRDERPDRRDERRGGPRPPRRDGPPGPRREGNRPGGPRRRPPGPESHRRRPPRGDPAAVLLHEAHQRPELPPPLADLYLSVVAD